jgi:hypothetical protein
MDSAGRPTEGAGEESVACLRCGVQITVERNASTLALTYNVVNWRSKCCCGHMGSPVGCCSFLDLEGAVLNVFLWGSASLLHANFDRRARSCDGRNS